MNPKHRLHSLRMVAGLAKFLQHPDDLTNVVAFVQSLEGSPLTTQMVNHLLAIQVPYEAVFSRVNPSTPFEGVGSKF